MKKCFHKPSRQDDSFGSLPTRDILRLHVSQILWYFSKHHQDTHCVMCFPNVEMWSRKDGALPDERILDQCETPILHGQDLPVVDFSDTLYTVYQCNDQGARIIYTPFLFEPKSFMDKAETGADLGEQAKKMRKNTTQTIQWSTVL